MIHILFGMMKVNKLHSKLERKQSWLGRLDPLGADTMFLWLLNSKQILCLLKSHYDNEYFKTICLFLLLLNLHMDYNGLVV